MNRSLVAQFILRLQDRASGGLDRIEGRLQRVARMAQRLAAVGGILAGLSIMGPVREAAALERVMRDTAITAGLTGPAIEEMMARNMALFRQVSIQTNQLTRDLAQAAGTMVAAGGPIGDAWESIIPTVARVATAGGAAADDIARSGIAMVNNMRAAPAQLEQLYAAMIQGGRDGRFELRDMAQHFDKLTASAAGLRMQGPQAIYSIIAALQIARQGAGTNTEAANFLNAFMRDLSTTTVREGFSRMGVNLEGVLNDAVARGINPLEAAVQKIREITGGDMFRVSELRFTDQAMRFLRPMLQNLSNYVDIRDRARDAGPELITQAVLDRMRGLDATLTMISIAWEQFTIRLGRAAEGPLRILANTLLGLVTAFHEWDAAFPGLLDNLALIGTGLAVAVTAVGALGLVLLPLKVALVALISPIGLAVAGVALLAAGAVVLWRTWSRIPGWLRGIWNGAVGVFRWAADGVWEVLDNIGTVAVAFLGGAWRGLVRVMTAIWEQIREPFDAFAAWVVSWAGEPVGRAVKAIQDAFQPLTSWFSALWQGMRGPFDTFIEGVTERIRRLQQAWDNLRGAQPEPTPAPGPQQGQRNWANRSQYAAGMYGAEAMAGAMGGGAPPITINGEILVRPTEGAEVVRAESGNDRVPITVAPQQNRGRMRGRE